MMDSVPKAVKPGVSTSWNDESFEVAIHHGPLSELQELPSTINTFYITNVIQS